MYLNRGENNMEEIVSKKRRVNEIKPVKVHTLSTHRWHMKKYGRCPYCKAGSKPVSREKVLEGL